MSRVYYRNHAGIKTLARGLRKNMTDSEIAVWKILRGKNLLGYKFLRQHPVFYSEDKNWTDYYIVDFYCNRLRLIIEIDGKIHENQVEYDQERDQKMKEKGLKVIRIKNESTIDSEVLKSCLLELIKTRISEL
jgi:very-short-patch-repair endonuclease